MKNLMIAHGAFKTIGAVEQPHVTISGPTVDWVKAEVASYLAKHPGCERRALMSLRSRIEYRKMARAFYGEGGRA